MWSPTTGLLSAALFLTWLVVEPRAAATLPDGFTETVVATDREGHRRRRSQTLTLDGAPVTAPVTFTGVVGIERTLGAPSPQMRNRTSYAFQSWSDAGSQ